MKAWYSSSFDWKILQLAIGEIPSEPLIAMMNTDTRKIVARLLAGSGFPISVISANQW
jgi:hypothetical protein